MHLIDWEVVIIVSSSNLSEVMSDIEPEVKQHHEKSIYEILIYI
jgi:hypothetical protein